MVLWVYCFQESPRFRVWKINQITHVFSALNTQSLWAFVTEPHDLNPAVDGLRDTFKYLISRQIHNLSVSPSHVTTEDSGRRFSGHGCDKGESCRHGVVK